MNFPQIRRLLEKYQEFVLTCHETPDGDAIGSEIALYHALLSRGKRVRIVNSDPAPDKYSYLYEPGTVELVTEKDDLSVGNSVLIILDTNDIHNIGMVATKILPGAAEYFIIDHHESGSDIATGRVIEVEASSTCEILYKIFIAIGIEINLPAAIALYTGIIYDTGCFVYPKTTAFTFDAAAHLVRIGADPYRLYSAIYESNSISSLMLQSKVLGTLELLFDNRVAVQTMRKETIIEAGADYEEADTIINFPLRSERVRVSVFFKENLEGLLRCSLRSKGNINVSLIAQKFGGGGHKTAAGFKSPYPLEKIRKHVIEELKSIFS